MLDPDVATGAVIVGATLNFEFSHLAGELGGCRRYLTSIY